MAWLMSVIDNVGKAVSDVLGGNKYWEAAVKRLEKQRKAWEDRAKKIQRQLAAKIEQLNAKQIQDKTKYDKELEKIKIDNDDTLKELEEVRRKEREEWQNEIKNMYKKKEEEMNKFQHNELIRSLHQSIKLIKSELEQYKIKKDITMKMFINYKNDLIRIENERSRLRKYFHKENNNQNMLNLVLIGITGHGKSTFGNRLCGDTTSKCDSFFKHNANVNSLTQDIGKEYVFIHNKHLSITDTPGIFDAGGADTFHANNLIEFLKGCGGVNAFLIVKSRLPPRIDKAFQNSLLQLQDLLGRDFWQHVIFILTHTKGAHASQEIFNKYSDEFRDFIYRELSIDKNAVKLQCIGVDSFENYKKPIKDLINIIPKNRFNCSNLRSPLQELRIQNNNIRKEFENQQNELNAMKETIYLTNDEIKHANKLLFDKFDKTHRGKKIDLSLIENERKDEWDVSYIINDNNKNNKNTKKRKKRDENDEMDDSEPNQKRQKLNNNNKNKNIKPNKCMTHTYLGTLSDDNILSFTTTKWKVIELEIKLNENSNNYNEIIDVFEQAKNMCEDVLITIKEYHYNNHIQREVEKAQIYKKKT